MRPVTRMVALVSVGGMLAGCPWRKTNADAGADAAVLTGPRPVTLPNAADGWITHGTYVPSTTGDGSAVLLVHQLGSDRGEWAPFFVRMARQPRPLPVLAIDLRGHGESTRNPSGSTETWRDFEHDPARWAALSQDVASGVRFLALEAGARRVVVVGASIGGSAAVLAAADEGRIAGLALLSPGLNYHGVRIEDAFRRYVGSSRPALLWSGDADGASAEAVAALGSLGGPLVTTAVEGVASEHGVALLNAQPARWERLFRFIDRVVGRENQAPPVPQGGNPRP